jgi:hypothetical protein
MTTTYRPSGVPQIDKDVEKILGMPIRGSETFSRLDGVQINPDKTTDIIVVGAGFWFAHCAVALIAAGGRVTAYEMDPYKKGKGRRGLMGANKYLPFGEAISLPQLFPDLTPDLLEKLPPFISTIANSPGYQNLMAKRETAVEMHWKARKEGISMLQVYTEYNALPGLERISVKELVDMNIFVIDMLQNLGVLNIRYQEVTFQMVDLWLKENRPVFLATGRLQATYANISDRIHDTDGFIEEFSEGTRKTDAMIERISSGGQKGDCLIVVFVGGGEKELLKTVWPDCL